MEICHRSERSVIFLQSEHSLIRFNFTSLSLSMVGPVERSRTLLLHLKAKMCRYWHMYPSSHYSNWEVTLNIGVILITADKNKLLKNLNYILSLGLVNSIQSR